MITQDTSAALVDSKGKKMTVLETALIGWRGGDVELAPAIASEGISVLSAIVFGPADIRAVRFGSNNGSNIAAISPNLNVVATNPLVLCRNQDGWFRTFSGESLVVSGSVGDPMDLQINYAYNSVPDSRAPGTLNLASATQTEAGTAHTATITVNRSDGFNGSVTFNYATADGTAVDGVNYTAASGSATIGDGVGSATIGVTIITGHATLNKTFTLTISNAGGGATLGTVTVDTVTISHL